MVRLDCAQVYIGRCKFILQSAIILFGAFLAFWDKFSKLACTAGLGIWVDVLCLGHDPNEVMYTFVPTLDVAHSLIHLGCLCRCGTWYTNIIHNPLIDFTTFSALDKSNWSENVKNPSSAIGQCQGEFSGHNVNVIQITIVVVHII